MDCLVSTFSTQNNTIVILIYVDNIYFKNCLTNAGYLNC